jgi:DNA-binding MarR family transcriptional regulator
MTSSPKKLPIEIPLTGLLDIAFDAMIAEFRTELEKTEFSDIRPTHGCVFRFVQGGGGMRLTEIAERANMTKQSVGEIVDDLAARGYVKRVPDPEDRRAKLVCLTERGKEAQAFGRRLFAEVEQRWAERYGAARIAGLRETLEEITATEAPFAVPELAAQQELSTA